MTTTMGRMVFVLARASRNLIVRPRESALQIRMALWVILISCLARVTTLPRLQSIVSFGARSTPAADPFFSPTQLARAIDSLLGMGLGPFRPSCWKRALVLHRYLALTGVESRINFGVRKQPDGTVSGHAWLERHGRLLLEDDASGPYVVTFSLPRDRATPAGVLQELSDSRLPTPDSRTRDLRPQDDREMGLLIECARASVEPDGADRIRAIAAAALDWDRLLKLAHRNGLAPLLYTHLSRIGEASVPAAALASLRDYFQRNSAFSLLLTGELIRLLATLRDRGIDAIPYKGPALAVKLYGHVALRQFGDLDILVRERDVWDASRAIEAQGFVPDVAVPDGKRATFLRDDYVQLFRRDAGRTLVELHWRIAEPYFAVPFDAGTLWPRREVMPLQGTTVSMPCAEDLLLMLCVHGGRHGWDKLEGVCSVAELLRRTPALDWDYVGRRSREMHCQRMLALGLLLVQGLFHLPLPPPAAAMARSRARTALAASVVRHLSTENAPPRTFMRKLALHLRIKDSFADRMRHCVRLALTPTPDDWASVRLRDSWSFAYPLVRAIRLAGKLAPRRAVTGRAELS